MRTNNETTIMSLLNQTLEKSAWKNISSSDDIEWSLELMEQFKDHLDWEALSENRKVKWTIPILDKFKKKIHWEELSNELLNSDVKDMDLEAILTKFEDQLDWRLLSKGGGLLTIHIIRKFADNWRWIELLDSYYLDEFSISEIMAFESHFPLGELDKLCHTRFWQRIVSQREKILVGQILSS